ncbi:MAG: NAD(P)/FAD-dependent oxidoreductase [Bdellovibrionales bacterium]|nr:NAD(P)/FAD-dependent oxidoreductase [Bdellovibrionales bacterium]
MRERLVVIGNGMAGIRVVDEILKRDSRRYEILIFGSEPEPAYDRIMLSSVLSGEKKLEEIFIHPLDWYEQNGIRLVTGREAVSLERKSKIVHTEDGGKTHYDKLILATGANAVFLNVPGKNLKGVVVYRSNLDVQEMITISRHKKRAVVIGGGLLGLEAAHGLVKQGMDVTVVHIFDTLMDRQLDFVSGKMLKQTLENRGLKFLMPKMTKALVSDEAGWVRALRFQDGTEIEAELVVVTVGILPRIDLAVRSGLNCQRGIVVDDYMGTSDPAIFAVGECVEHRGATYGLVAPLYEMARTCAEVLTEAPDKDVTGSHRLQSHAPQPSKVTRYKGSTTSAKLKVVGVDMFSAGKHTGDPWTEDIIIQDHFLGIYKKLVVRENRIVGIVLYGDTEDASWYFQMLKENRDISDIRDRVIFGRAMVSATSGPMPSLSAAMTNEMEVCGCNGVCKGAIVQAIQSLRLTSLEEVRAHTKASASCGSCTPLVKDILLSALGPGSEISPAREGICSCTECSTEDIREAIRAQRLLTIEAVMTALSWKNPEGCSTCRPALNYYLLSAFSGEYVDHFRSRFVNERLHANIQKDGTYSVVPRMWGGLTSPSELRAIADVADKYGIPTVKVTGGQRIDLLGVKKEDLPGVWRDLNSAGMVSGHAYGKALRTVKTCVGSEWCRFGVQDSTTMGVRLEKMTWGTWTPHKVKLAASGCPRNCAEATIKDLGVVALDSGWEIHVGGNGGMKVRVADLLCKVQTQEEVLEYTGAFLQLYRKEAHYLERTAHWIERVGIAFVKEKLIQDTEGRKRLHREFLESQESSQVDPWAALSASRTDLKEFVTFNVLEAEA